MNTHTRRIAHAIARTNLDAAQRYLDLAPVREKIDREAKDANREYSSGE